VAPPLKSAFGDLDEGRAFYAQHGDELGDYFLDSLFADIDSLALYGGIHVRLWGFHRMLARRFPYPIYYKVDADVCTVWRGPGGAAQKRLSPKSPVDRRSGGSRSLR
jgi:hypothetical protein